MTNVFVNETLDAMRVILTVLVIIIVIGAIVLGYLFGVAQKPIPLPAELPDIKLPSLGQEGGELQGFWKVEQILEEDENGKLKIIVQAAPGATENYFLFEGNHVCTEGNLDINRKPQPCRSYTTFSVAGDKIEIDQPGRSPGKSTWKVAGDTLELSFAENGKKGKIILLRLPQK